MRVVLSGSEVWVVGGNWTETAQVKAGFPRPGIMFRSRDGGNSWENRTPKTASLLYDVFLMGGKGWLVGAEGAIYYSSDNGDSWARVESPTKTDLLHIFFLNNDNGWISGGRSTILKLK